MKTQVPVIYTPQKTHGQILNEMTTDKERYLYCEARAREARDEWFLGQQDEVARIKYSTSRQYKGLDQETRSAVGKTLWSHSIRAKDLAGTEQMWHRWAAEFRSRSVTV